MTTFKIIGIGLVIVHIALDLWALGGMTEWLGITVPWNHLSNPAFPKWLLFFHWGAILFAATGFIWGYFAHWKHTPAWMIIGYGMMGLVCIVETFGYMTSKTKFLAMGLEYTAYIIILLILFNPTFRSMHFVR